jgi:tRNA G10  N-methylase Trm11
MPYRFATDSRSYIDLASGRVLRSRPGHPAFPVRLAREMFEQARALRGAAAVAPAVLYDPCCGAGHLLTTLGLLHAPQLSAAIGSDADEAALSLARQNLRLLEPGGLQARADELAALFQQHGNPAHRAALDSARSLATAQAATIPVHLFRADALDPAQLAEGLGPRRPDIVVADAPYGRLSSWSAGGDGHPLETMLGALAQVLPPGAVVALATGKETKIAHPRFHRARQLQLGGRRVTWLVVPGSA